MVRYVLFEGAPTVKQCLEHFSLAVATYGSWDTVIVEPAPPGSSHQSTRQARPPSRLVDPASATLPSWPSKRARQSSNALHENIWDITGSQFLDAVEGDPAAIESDIAAASSDEVEPDRPERTRKRPRRRTSASKGLDFGPENSTCRTSFIMPPPSQPRPRPSATLPARHSQQPHNVSFLLPLSAPLVDNSRLTPNYTVDASYDATYADGISLGAPPYLPWKIYQLTALNQLRQKLSSNRGGPPPLVSVLAAVNSFDQRETAQSMVTEVTLIDDSGQTVKLVLWGAAGVEIARLIRRADILYVSNVLVKEYANTIQLSFNEHKSQLGICWRSHILDEDDYQYRFHEGWRDSLVEAEEVLKQADWFSSRFG